MQFPYCIHQHLDGWNKREGNMLIFHAQKHKQKCHHFFEHPWLQSDTATITKY